MGRKLQARFMEDNTTAITTMVTGKTTMRHLGRTHRVSLAFLHEVVENQDISIEHCDTDWMCADIFTKAFPARDKWNHVRTVIAHIDPKLVWRDYRPAVKPHPKEKSAALPSLSAAPAPKPPPTVTERSKVSDACTYNRLLVELCAGGDSLLGRKRRQARGCKCVRVTAEDDLTTESGVAKALEAIRAADGVPILVWVSIPCTGGSSWQFVNARHPGHAARMRVHLALFEKLWAACTRIVDESLALGALVCWEWPSGCAYWRKPAVQDFMS